MNTTPEINNLNCPKVEQFCETHMAAIVRNAQAARVILRTVLLALHAQDSGAISQGAKGGASIWSAAISAVLTRLDTVRDTLMETGDSPPLDWPTPHALASALDSALWDGYCTGAAVLTTQETTIAIQVVIDSLDDMLRDCAMAGSDNTKVTGGGTIQ